MNKSTHRLIFNQRRGCLMAVAETAGSCTKSPSGTSKARRRSSKCSKASKSSLFHLLKMPLAQWIRAQAAPIFILPTCASFLFISGAGALLSGREINTRTQTDLGQTGSIAVAGNASIKTKGDFEQTGATLSVGANLTADIGGSLILGAVQRADNGGQTQIKSLQV